MTIRNLWHRDQDRAYGFRSPDKLPKGRVLVHNHIKHTVDMPDDFNGFRCWTQDMEGELIRCGCGWRGVEHYSPVSLQANGQLFQPGNPPREYSLPGIAKRVFSVATR